MILEPADTKAISDVPSFKYCNLLGNKSIIRAEVLPLVVPKVPSGSSTSILKRAISPTANSSRPLPKVTVYGSDVVTTDLETEGCVVVIDAVLSFSGNEVAPAADANTIFAVFSINVF